MSKKESNWKNVAFDLGLNFLGDGVKHIYEYITERTNELIDETQKKVSDFLAKVAKTTILLSIILFGALFVFIGLAQYIGDVLSHIGAGLGYLIVGGSLILLGIIVKFLK